MRFVMCYKNVNGWKLVKDNNNNFIIKKVLNNSKTELKIANLKCNLEIINNWFSFVEKYKTKEIEPILEKKWLNILLQLTPPELDKQVLLFIMFCKIK